MSSTEVEGEEEVALRRSKSPGRDDKTEKSLTSVDSNKSKYGLPGRAGLKGKPKPLYFWSTSDVNKWLRKHGGVYYELYGDLLSEHQITGRTLIRMTDIKLEKIGILDTSHRHDLMQFFLRLRLKHEMNDIRNLNSRGSGFELKLTESRGQGATDPNKLSVEKYAMGNK